MKKQKFSSAEEKRRYYELNAQWENIQSKWQSVSESSLNQTPAYIKKSKKSVVSTVNSRIPPGRTTTTNIPSIDSGHTGAVGNVVSKQYTGSNVLGIAVMHKSCLQPVFNQEEAIASSKMRRG